MPTSPDTTTPAKADAMLALGGLRYWLCAAARPGGDRSAAESLAMAQRSLQELAQILERRW